MAIGTAGETACPTFGLFPVAGQALEDRPTGRVGEGLENIVRHGLHIGNHNHTVIGCQSDSRPLVAEKNGTNFLWESIIQGDYGAD